MNTIIIKPLLMVSLAIALVLVTKLTVQGIDRSITRYNEAQDALIQEWRNAELMSMDEQALWGSR
ncbi:MULTISPECIES: hypothetical protein [Moraxella]|uniref:Uncharacterized protein n=1 Tax=Moraxella catarrhalis TaxID=480 RepID=A0A7Z0UYA6_MORCA|nr:hypothetical protein [Moraxella catarrhalis]OAV00249.1 hypothetical protein AO382_1399 [Moraxella catarrhalis]STY82517.1 Uncharacterised protein [Moraxella catarrhalis]